MFEINPKNLSGDTNARHFTVTEAELREAMEKGGQLAVDELLAKINKANALAAEKQKEALGGEVVLEGSEAARLAMDLEEREKRLEAEKRFDEVSPVPAPLEFVKALEAELPEEEEEERKAA